MDKLKMLKVLDMIRIDLKADLKELDGKEFSGKTVAPMFGYQAAAIDAIAGMLIEIIKESKDV